MKNSSRSSVLSDANYAAAIPAAERPLSRNTVPRPKLGWMLVVFIVFVCGMVALFLIGWKPLTQRQAMLLANAENVKTAAPRVAVVTPHRGAMSTEILLPGEVQAVRETTIYARTSGYLKRWLVDIGDSVKEGQLLAEIHSPEVDIQLEHSQAGLEQAQAAVEQSEAALEQGKALVQQYEAAVEQAKAQLISAQANAELAELTMKRFVSLRGTGGATEQDISDKETAAKAARAVVLANEAGVGLAKAAVNSANAALVAAQAAIHAAQANVRAAKSDVRRLEAMKSFERMTAPFDGTITTRQAEAGALVTAGSGSGAQPLFHIACTDTVRVFVDVPQSYAPAVKTGQSVQLILRERPDSKYTGTVSRTSHAIEQASRTLRTEIQIPNPNGELMNGMYGQVKFNVKSETAPLLLPGSALVVNANGTQVAVVRAGRVHYQMVVLDGDYGANVGVTSGVLDSDSVITNPSERLTEDLAVTVTTPKAE